MAVKVKPTAYEVMYAEIDKLEAGVSDMTYNEIRQLIYTYYLEDKLNSMEHDLLDNKLKRL